jgi:uncharacterized protein (TIGR03437 family)
MLMRKAMLAAALLAPLAFSQTQTITYSYSGIPLPIYPDDWDTITVISLFVPRSMTISKVTAAVQAQYSGLGDLNLFLYSPAGTRTKLLERNCGSVANLNATFDDGGSAKFSDACPSASTQGTFRGNEPLANSNGENSFGYWRVAIENNGSDSRSGTISGFTVTITGAPTGPPIIGPNTIVSVAGLEGGPIAPGDQVALIGVNLGPGEGVRANTGTNLPTTLGGTSVTFDGAPAPMFYSSSGLVIVQAPTGLSPGTTPRIQVTAANGTSPAVPAFVIQTKPGILTTEVRGVGQAKANNQDGTRNGDGTVAGSTGAAPGSVISVYATGLGPVTPPVPQGAPASLTTLSPTNLPVTANIAGRAANVQWAGAAPGQIGVYQVNIVVPLGTPAGAARLSLSVDGNGSQPGVTVQIR